MRFQQGSFVVDTVDNTVRMRPERRSPEMRERARLLGRLRLDGPDALGGLLAAGVTMDLLATDPANGRRLPKAAEVLFCALLSAGRPDHEELLRFAGGEIAECVLPACRFAEAALARKVIAKAAADGAAAPRAAIRTMVYRPDGITPEEVRTTFPDDAGFAFAHLLHSGRFPAEHVVREGRTCGPRESAALFEALVERREYDLARTLMPALARDAVRTDTKVAYDMLRILDESEARIAADILFGVSHGRLALP